MSYLLIRPSASRLVAVGSIALAACLVFTLADVGRAQAASQDVPLGTAASFAVLAGSTVTDVPATTTVISGDVGSSSGTSMTNLTPANLINGGAMFAADPGGVAAGAQVDLTTAYNQAAGQTPFVSAPADLASANLIPGVYRPAVGNSFSNSGNLTLTGTGAPGEYFVFQMPSTLTMAAGSTITLINVSPCNVFWQVGSSATLGTNSFVVGTIMADQSIAAANGAVIQGRLLARIGAVTLDNNTITSTMCALTRAGTASVVAAAAAAEAARLAATGFNPLAPAIAGLAVIVVGALILARRKTRRQSSRAS